MPSTKPEPSKPHDDTEEADGASSKKFLTMPKPQPSPPKMNRQQNQAVFTSGQQSNNSQGEAVKNTQAINTMKNRFQNYGAKQDDESDPQYLVPQPGRVETE